jgi:hypothetical protein
MLRTHTGLMEDGFGKHCRLHEKHDQQGGDRRKRLRFRSLSFRNQHPMPYDTEYTSYRVHRGGDARYTEKQISGTMWEIERGLNRQPRKDKPKYSACGTLYNPMSELVTVNCKPQHKP